MTTNLQLVLFINFKYQKTKAVKLRAVVMSMSIVHGQNCCLALLHITGGELLGLEPVSMMIKKSSLRWFGRGERKDDTDWVKCCCWN